MAALKDEEGPLLQLPVVGDLEKMSRGKRLGLTFALLMALLVPLAVITLLMTGEPPKDSGPGTTTSTTTETPAGSTP